MTTASESTREWKKSNPELVRAQNARYREKHREAIKTRARDRYQVNPGPRRESGRRWRLENPEKVDAYQRAYYRENKDRKYAQNRAWVEQNADYNMRLQQWHRDGRARVITPRATNGRAPWTEAETRIAVDRSLSLAEAALMLGRTVNAVGQQRSKQKLTTDLAHITPPAVTA